MSESTAGGVIEPPRKWLWFRTTIDGRSAAEKEFFKLPKAAIATLTTKMSRYAEGASRRHDVDHLGDGIYEIRARLGNNHYRVLFFRWGRHLVALSAFYKNQQKTPKQDIDTAIARRKLWRDAFGDERLAGDETTDP
jgi:phage-related protein